MPSLNVQAPDGKTLTVDVPPGTDPKQYGDLADDALSHYTGVVKTQASPDSAFDAAGRGFANNLPLLPQMMGKVIDNTTDYEQHLKDRQNYSQNLANWNQQAAQSKAAHPVAYGAGAVGGAIAPSLIPGVGAAMSAAPKTSGAILGALNAISNTDLQQHPVQAAGQAALGGGTGALLGGLISKLLPASAALESKANTLANKSIGMPAGILVDMTPEEQQAQGAFLRSTGMVGTDKAKILDTARNSLQEYGQKIGSIGKDLEAKGLSVDDPNQLTQPLIQKFAQFSQSANPEAKQLSRTYLAGINDIENLSKPAIDESESATKLSGPTGQALPPSEAPSEPITWSKLQGLKETYGGLAFKPTGEIKNQAAADVYFSLSGAIKDIADKAQTNANIPAQYQQALSGYSRMSPIVSGLEKTVDADLRGATSVGGGFHPMRMLASMPRSVRAVGGTLAAATGHPMLAAAAALPDAFNPAIQSQVAGGLAQGMPDIQAGIQQLATKAASNPGTQKNINDLIQKLKEKWNAR